MAKESPPGDVRRVLARSADRLDRALALALPTLSRSRLKDLIKTGRVQVDGRTVDDPSQRINAGSDLTLDVPAPVPAQPVARAMALAIVYEDEDLIVIDKPAGLVVHPGAGHGDDTLVNALLAHCGDSLSGIGGVERPGIVHRLDKDTSGLLVVAKSDRAHRGLAEQFADHGRTGPLERAYRALVWAVPSLVQGTVRAPLARSQTHRERMAVAPPGRGRDAITHWRRLEIFPEADAALLDCRLETGRTHQIRVHLAHIGHPIVGDSVYGLGFRSKQDRLSPLARDRLAALGRQALHAAHLGFAHPVTGRTLSFDSPLPEDMENFLQSLRVGR